MPETVAPGILLHSRAECGLTGPVGGSTGAGQAVLRVHHGASATPSGAAAAARVWRGYQDWHRRGNGWADIGYSFGVARDPDPEKAHILVGRGWGRVGAHTSGHNSDLGVCFVGSGGSGVNLTPGVKRAFDYLRRARFSGPRKAYGHRDTSNSTCPGDALYGWVRAGMPVKALERVAPEPGMTEYLVQAGDTLASIAAEAYGDASLWTFIRDSNPKTLRGGTLIIAGETTLWLPGMDRIPPDPAPPNPDPEPDPEPKTPDPRRYVTTVFAVGRDAALVAALVDFLRLGDVELGDEAAARRAVTVGDRVVAVGGPAVRALAPDAPVGRVSVTGGYTLVYGATALDTATLAPAALLED
jgi:hypothetical protein